MEHIQSSLETGTISVCGPASLEFDESELKKFLTNNGFSYRSLSKLDSCSLIEDASEQVKSSVQVPHEKHLNDAHHEGRIHD